MLALNIKIHLFYFFRLLLILLLSCLGLKFQHYLTSYKKIIVISNFQPRNVHNNTLFKQSTILKFQDKIYVENILFVSKSLNDLSPSIFDTWFTFFSDQHNYVTALDNLIQLFYKTNRYGKYQITLSDVELWNKIEKQIKDT